MMITLLHSQQVFFRSEKVSPLPPFQFSDFRTQIILITYSESARPFVNHQFTDRQALLMYVIRALNTYIESALLSVNQQNMQKEN